ncbi:MAG TPA: hypothetical protein VK337_11360 [Xanthobacteraceae bacterium]|nr:hypothetical protein [Xanthobacteraceae bacterium]
MRCLAVAFAVVALAGFAGEASAGKKIRLAQTSTTTKCLMTCNAQAATCQAACFLPPAPAVGSTTSAIAQAQTPGPNPTASTSCVMNCSTTQLTCQTTCARISPSQ